jgi:hypothetical protein
MIAAYLALYCVIGINSEVGRCYIKLEVKARAI